MNACRLLSGDDRTFKLKESKFMVFSIDLIY